MAELTKTEISKEDFPQNFVNGASRRRVRVTIRGTSTANTNTLNIATYIPNFAAVEGIEWEMIDGAINAGTDNTFATTIVTFAGHAGSGVWIMSVVGYLT